MNEGEDYEIVRFYRINKYPLMMGRLPDGSKIFGGPYTAAQGITGAAMIILVLSTWGLWANYGLFGNVIFAGMAVLLPVYLAGMIRTKNRNPVTVFFGAISAWAAPGGGKVGNDKFTFRKPHQTAGAPLMDGLSRPTPEQPDPEPVPAVQPIVPVQMPEPTPASVPAARRPVTALDRLMAQSTPQKQ